MTAAYWSESAKRAFERWCDEANLAEDYDAPHAEAFLGGWQAGRNDGIDTTLGVARGR